MYVPSSSVAPIPEVPFVHYDVFPYNHKFCRNDYVLHKQRVEAFFRLPHARAALLMGGIVWRIAVEVLDLEHVLFGPSGSRTYQHMIKLAEGDAVDDRLSQAECDLICGVSHVLNSHQAVDSASDVSWWPKQDTFERDSWGFWSWRDEVWYRARREEIHSDDPEKAGPKAAWSWRNTFKQGSRQRAAMEMLEREGTGLIR
ncbi:hypothetical protein NM688_g1035 [Phlebia brevispora]|uniref:Uncharacterized protein n=1 Tax=Phlebia brevispora TaxID=194682 RepID=A0ACC1TCY6_9APHY|nr:hypothetical protein NM688_g1035 [Phlebia brevispora]